MHRAIRPHCRWPEPRPTAATRTDRQRGAEIVEFLITLPVILLILAIFVDFGAALTDKLVLTDAARAATRVAIRGADDSAIQQAADRITANLLRPAALPQAVITRGGNAAGAPITVSLTHTYRYLLLPNFLGGAAGLPLQASVRMNRLSD